MNTNEARKKSISELYKDLAAKRKEINLLKLHIKAGKSSDINKKRSLKKEIARINTVITEKKVLEKNEKA